MGHLKISATIALASLFIIPFAIVTGQASSPSSPGSAAKELAANDDLEAIVRGYLSGGKPMEAERAISDHIIRERVENAAICSLCVSALRNEVPGSEDQLVSVVTAGFDRVDEVAHETNSGELLLRLADIAIESSSRPALARGTYYLLEALRVGNVTDDARYSAGRLLYELGRYDDARRLFQRLADKESSKYYQSETLSSWIAFLTKEMERASLVTDRLLASDPSNSNQDYLPIFKQAPVYPKAAREDGRVGSVVVEFTVGANGRTKDIRVVSATDRVFEEATVEAASQFLYMPQVANGVPVERPGVKNKITFQLP